STTAVPRVTFTQPEVAAVGVSTEAKPGRTVVHWSHAEVDRAVAEASTSGFTKLVVDDKGTILGASIVSPRAGESLGELTLAVKHGLKARDLAATTHPYPTFSDGAWNAAIYDVQERLTRPPYARAIRALSGVRRWLLERR
ncbi:MAG: oxidoreductase, partial [Lapillicoccus sp.]